MGARVNEYGTWSEGIVELKFEVAYDDELTANDVAEIILINDGDTEKNA